MTASTTADKTENGTVTCSYLNSIELDLCRSLLFVELFLIDHITSDKLNICKLIFRDCFDVGNRFVVRGKTTRCVATRIPRTVFRGSHSGLIALKFLRGSLKILQRLKRFLTPKLLPPSIYSRAKLSVIYRRESGRKEAVVECVLSLPLSFSLSVSHFFSLLPSSLGGAFVCLAKPVFDRAGLRAAISGPRAPSSLLLPGPLRVPHIRYGTCNVLNPLLSLVHSDDLFFPPESLSGVKSSPARRRDGERGDGGARKIGKKSTFIMKRYLSLRPT